MLYKKLAGTAAVFVNENFAGPSPIERDGMVWQESELQLEALAQNPERKADIATPLALEGLEEYDPASDGDIRFVSSLEHEFIYKAAIKAWIQFN